MLHAGMTRFLTFVLCTLVVSLGAAVAQKPFVISGPLVDPERLLSDRAAAEIHQAAMAFKQASGHWMVFVVSSRALDVDLSQRFATWESRASPSPIGIVYAVTRGKALGELTVIAPAWQTVAGVGRCDSTYVDQTLAPESA